MTDRACRRCGAPMRAGIALVPTLVGRPGSTTLTIGPGMVVPVTKCPDCGHSFTGSDAAPGCLPMRRNLPA